MRNKFLNDFKTFIDKGSAIDMAVGIIVGSVMTSVVNSLVKDVIMPPVGLMVGGVDFSQWFIILSGGQSEANYATIEAAQAAGATTLNIGLFINSIVSFLITMFAIFIFVKIVNGVRSKKPVTTHECPYCKQQINILATKCQYCASSVKPEEVAVEEETDLQKSLSSLKTKVEKATKIAKRVIKK